MRYSLSQEGKKCSRFLPAWEAEEIKVDPATSTEVISSNRVNASLLTPRREISFSEARPQQTPPVALRKGEIKEIAPAKLLLPEGTQVCLSKE